VRLMGLVFGALLILAGFVAYYAMWGRLAPVF
jgi:hypothetical protein